MNHDVFICYSSLDHDVAYGIYESLLKQGINPWIYEKDQTSGKPYQELIVDAINDCKVFVLIHSSNSNKSDDVLNEVRIACKLKKPIIPLKIEEVDYSNGLDYHVGSLHWIKAYSMPKEDYNRELIKNTIQFIPQRNMEQCIVKGRVIIRNTNISVGSADVSIIEASTNNKIANVRANAYGQFEFSLKFVPDNQYLVYANKRPYNEGFSEHFKLVSGGEITKDIHLTTDFSVFDPQFQIYKKYMSDLEYEWMIERDSDPLTIDKGKYILRKAFAFLIEFRNQIDITKGSDFDKSLTNTIKKLREMEDHEVYCDGNKSFNEFWEKGNQLFEMFNQLPYEYSNQYFKR